MTDQGRARGTRDPGGAIRITVPGGAKRGRSQGGADLSTGRGGATGLEGAIRGRAAELDGLSRRGWRGRLGETTSGDETDLVLDDETDVGEDFERGQTSIDEVDLGLD